MGQLVKQKAPIETYGDLRHICGMLAVNHPFVESYADIAKPVYDALRGGRHDTNAALDRRKSAGVRLIDEAPRPGAGGHLVAFLHPKAMGGSLVELVERAH